MLVVGTFLTVFGMMMLSLAREYWQIFLAQGLCIGLGTGFLFLPSVAIVATYFTSKRALAIGLVASGGSIGSVIYPIIFERLQPRIDFPWATRVLGFIALATLCVSIMTLKPRVPPPNRSRALLDISAFKDLPFIFFSLGLFLSFAGLYIPIFYIISWSEAHIHLQSDLSFYMLAVLNGASVFGRIIPGILADRFGGLDLIIAYCTSCAILSFAAIVINNLGGLVVFAILYGFDSGAFVSLPASVVASLAPNIGLVGTWIGMSFLFAGLGVLVGNPIAGNIIHVPISVHWRLHLFGGSNSRCRSGIYRGESGTDG